MMTMRRERNRLEMDIRLTPDLEGSMLEWQDMKSMYIMSTLMLLLIKLLIALGLVDLY